MQEGDAYLWKEGHKKRYYESKFAVGPDDIDFRTKITTEYVRGLCWVLQYYYQVNQVFIIFLIQLKSSLNSSFFFKPGRPFLEVVFSLPLCSVCIRFSVHQQSWLHFPERYTSKWKQIVISASNVIIFFYLSCFPWNSSCVCCLPHVLLCLLLSLKCLLDWWLIL